MAKNYAFGRVSGFDREKNSAWVQVIGFFTEMMTGYQTLISPSSKFPNRGSVLAPSCAKVYPFVKEGDYIVFSYVENERLTIADKGDSKKDLYIIPLPQDEGEVRICSSLLLPCSSYSDEDIQKPPIRDVPNPQYTKFYFRRETSENGRQCKYICGPLKVVDKKLIPYVGTEISAWQEQSGDVISVNGVNLIHPDFPNSRQPVFKIDCMTDKQLLNWFKNKTTNCDDQKTREKIEEIINHNNASDDQLTASRWERIKKKLGDSVYISEHLSELEKLEPFQKAIRQQLDEFSSEEKKRITDEIRAQAEADLEKEMSERRTLLETEIKELEKKKGDLESQKQKLEAAWSEAAAAIQFQEQSLNVLQEKKEELVEDIKLKAGLGLLGGPASGEWCYPLEKITPSTNAQAVSIGYWENMLYNFLDLPNNGANNGVAELKMKNFIKVEDIKLGVRIAKALGNTIYELCQPSPKWISFHEFWCESLKPIWESAHRNPEVWHFLLIENFNLALPECWGKPLWNILENKTSLLPCAKNPEYPGNLRIIVSAAPTESEDNTHLGLPTQCTPEELIIPDFRLDDVGVGDFLAKYYCGISNE